MDAPRLDDDAIHYRVLRYDRNSGNPGGETLAYGTWNKEKFFETTARISAPVLTRSN